jgi:hypothetical protein
MSKKLEIWVGVATIVGVIIAAIALIPAFGDWLSPRDPSTKTPITAEVTNQAITQTPPVVETTATAKSLKCDTIKTAFPQTLEEVRVKFGLPTNSGNFRLIYEECGAIATGFIFEGDTEFELSVPEGGCIDSYSGAYFSEQPVSHSFGGLRVYSGIVRATGMTYRVAWCELKQ